MSLPWRGKEGASRAITIAASRVVRALADYGCRARILTAPEIESAALQISRSVDPKAFTETWKHAPLPGVCNTGYGVDPRLPDMRPVSADMKSCPLAVTKVPGSGHETAR
ncbi:type VII secretion protein EccE [Rhodococcus opacus]|uniref:type VII secretion protein EccE n=1 Tax=Rhodococcus opacus TaxID=37919 RepID=UPI001F53EB2F|nr:type VII secretion protein EccE [Rhodococcus opacus]